MTVDVQYALSEWEFIGVCFCSSQKEDVCVEMIASITAYY